MMKNDKEVIGQRMKFQMNGGKGYRKQPSRCEGDRRVSVLKGDSEVDEKRGIMVMWRAKEEKRKMSH